METGEAEAVADDSVVSNPMAGGNGPYSYANNSSYQRAGLDCVKILIMEEITRKLNLRQLCSSKAFKVADMGCSIGPNTFEAVQNIIDIVESKRQSEGLGSLPMDYQVFFADHSTNDFNTLFNSLPRERLYFAAGVPGNFFTRLFPEASLHFVHSSFANHWISRAPNCSGIKVKGTRVYFGNKNVKPYKDQFARDMESFMRARGEELVPGGFLALLVPGIPRGANPQKCSITSVFGLFCSCLADMAKMGIVEEGKVDSFRMPLYFASPEELEEIAGRVRYFRIERVEHLARPLPQATREVMIKLALTMRSGTEQLVIDHFGNVIDMDDLYNRYAEKLLKFYLEADPSYLPVFDLFILLQRVHVA